MEFIPGRDHAKSDLHILVDVLKHQEEEDLEVQEKPELVDKSKRRSATLIYALILMMCGAVTAPLTPITDTVSRVFDQSVPTITLSTTIYSFAGVAFGIPANLLIGKIGIRKAVFVAVLLFTIGTTLRLFFRTSFYFVHAG